MSDKPPRSSIWPWVLRFALAFLALAAPIITFRAFTDFETSDPQRDDRLREVEERNRRNRERQNPPPQSAPSAPIVEP